MAKPAYTIKAYKHPRLKWVVRSKISGKWERRFFESKGDAQTYVGQKEIELLNQGREGVQFPTWLRTMAQRAQDRLQPHGKNIADATDFYVKHLETTQKSVTVAGAVKNLVDAKKAAGRGAQYCKELDWRLQKFVDSRQKDETLAQITAPQIEAFLSSLKLSPGTWNTYRRDLVTLWSYAIKAGFATVNEAQKCERALQVDAAPGILTPGQVSAVLSCSKDVDVLAAHAIGFFAGLRVSEINKLDWKDVDFTSGYIHVSAATSKTRSRRLVPLLPNSVKWLKPVAKKAGKITGPNFRRRSTAARRDAGIIPWPDNAMRHSFVSYRLADTGNAAQTALESGHDQAVLFRHYRELVRPNAAKKYFSIRPVGKKKVIDLSEAA